MVCCCDSFVASFENSICWFAPGKVIKCLVFLCIASGYSCLDQKIVCANIKIIMCKRLHFVIKINSFVQKFAQYQYS